LIININYHKSFYRKNNANSVLRYGGLN